MADINEIKSILQKALPNLSTGELEKLAKAISGAVGSASINSIDIDPTLLSQASSAAELQQKLVELQAQSRAEKEKDLQIAIEIDRLSGRKVEQSEISAAKEKIELQLALERLQTLQSMEALNENELKLQQESTENEGEIVKKLKIQTNLREQLQDYQQAGVQIGENFAKTIGFANAGLAGQISNVQGVGNKMKALGAIAKGVGVGMSAAFGPIGILANIIGFVVQSFMKIDKVNAELYSKTGISGLGFEAAEAASGMESLSVTGEKAANAQMGLLSGIKDFRNVNAGMRKDLIQTTALMEGVGVSAEDSGEAIGFMQSALGMTLKEAEEGSRELIALAEDLGRPANEIVRGFNEASDSLAKYGPDMQLEFQRLARASNVLNMDVGKLMNTFGEGFDTFEGAQTKAASLNALLGGPFLNGMELLGMTESERLVTLKQTLDQQGRTFDQMSKFEKMGIAKELGMSEKELGKLMNANAADMEAILNAEEIAAKKKEDMDKKNFKNMDMMTKALMAIEKMMQDIVGQELFSEETLNDIKEFIGGMIEIFDVIGKVIGAVKDFISPVTDAIGELFGLGDTGKSAFGGIVAAMLTIAAPLRLLKMGFGALGRLIASVFGGGAAAAGGMADAAAGAAPGGGGTNATKNINKAGNATGRLSKLLGKLKGIAGGVFRFMGSILKAPLVLLKGMGKALGFMKGMLPAIGRLLRSAFGGLKTLLRGAGGLIRGLISQAGRLGSSIARSVSRMRRRSTRRSTSRGRSKPSLLSRIGSGLSRGANYLGGKVKQGAAFVKDKAVAAKDFVVDKGKAVINSVKERLFKKGLPLMKAAGGRIKNLLSKVPVISTLLNGAMVASILMRDDLTRAEKAKEVVIQGSGMIGSGLGGLAGTLGGPIGSILGAVGGQVLGEWIGNTKPVQNFLAPMIEPMMPADKVQPSAPKQMDDGLIGAGANIQLNSADQAVALKEGGLLDQRFKEMIKLLKMLQPSGEGAGTGTPVVISMDGRKVAESVISQINKKYDLGV